MKSGSTVGEALGFVCLEAERGNPRSHCSKDKSVHVLLRDMIMPRIVVLEFLELEFLEKVKSFCSAPKSRVGPGTDPSKPP